MTNSFKQMTKAGVIKRTDTGMFIALSDIHVREGFNKREDDERTRQADDDLFNYSGTRQRDGALWRRHAGTGAAGGEAVSKSEAFKYAMIIGFGLAAGVHLYVAWASLLELAWGAIKGVFNHG